MDTKMRTKIWTITTKKVTSRSATERKAALKNPIFMYTIFSYIWPETKLDSVLQ